MENLIKKNTKRRSLRNLVFIWFFILTLIPFTTLAVIIQKLYQKSINQEIKNRLDVHIRELENLFEKEHSGMNEFLENILKNQILKQSLTRYKPEIVKPILQEKIKNFNQKKVKVYTKDGKIFISFNRSYRDVFNQPDLSMKDRLHLEKQDLLHKVLFKKEKDGKRNRLSLSLIRKIVLDSSEPPGSGESVKTSVYEETVERRAESPFSGGQESSVETSVYEETVGGDIPSKTIGYMETILSLSFIDLKKLSELMGAEVIFFDREGNVLLNTLPSSFDGKDPGPHFLKGRDNFFEMMISQVPYAFMSKVVQWGSLGFLMGLGTSKDLAVMNIRKLNYIILFTFLGFLLFLSLFSFYFVREVIRPIESLIRVSRDLKEKRSAPFIPNHSQTEIADLIDAFNEMSGQITESNKKMKKQLKLLEQANEKIKSTQSQLVQSAKLASLGELVAGIAHELNNPIGFIYSNISHLKNYMNSLFFIIDRVNESSSGKHGLEEKGMGLSSQSDVKALMEKQDYPYLKEDFPKLIMACEEGSRRAKDIVLGLKSFSRMDKDQLVDFDINGGLDSTLRLLEGEIKNRIEIHRDYEKLPKIKCNASQIKQVFMNILSNACHAIHDSDVDGSDLVSLSDPKNLEQKGIFEKKSVKTINEKNKEGDLYLTTRFDSKSGKIRVEIRDTGCGINKRNLEKIFDPFYTTKPVGKGTGLGLSISYGFIKNHHGEIGVDSEEGKGTSFWISLPVGY